MKLHSLLAIAGIAGAIICAPAALAQQQPEPAPWIAMKSTSGCTFYLYSYDDPAGVWSKKWPWTWTGACSGGVATGTGDLEAAMQSDSGHKYRSGYRGTMVGGRLNGRVEEIMDGKMPAAYYWQTFEMGCGTAEQFVYCKPYTGASAQQAATPPAKLPANAPTPQVLAKSDWEVIRQDLNISPEDRIFAVLSELATTGEINLVQQANVILARRYPNSPLLPVAMTIIDTLNKGDTWPPKDQAKTASAPAPAAPAPAPAPTATAVAPSNGGIDIEGLRRFAEAEFGPAKDITGTSASKLYEITLNREGFNIPITLDISKSGKYIWLSANVGNPVISAEKTAAALKRIGKIQPTMIWDSGSSMCFGLTIENRSLTQAMVKESIERLASDIVNNVDVWQ